MGRSLTERQAAAALGQLAAAVTVQDADGRLVFANAAAVRLLGAASEAEVLAASPGELFARFHVLHPDGRAVAADELPGRRALRGETPEPLLVRWVDEREGALRWSLVKATPLVDEGRVTGAVNVVEDVTAAHEARLAQQLLAEAARTLVGSLDHGRTLEHVARLAVPALADWCAVDVVVERGEPRRVTAGEGDGDAFRAQVGELVSEVLRTGRTELAPQLRGGPAHSALVVALDAGGRTIGALTLALCAPGRRFTTGDAALAEELGRRAGAAIEHARLYTLRGEITHVLQASLLPRHVADPPGWRVAVHFEAAGEANEVGGDFYDVSPLADGHLVMVGDVLGKGAGAAAVTPRVRHTLAAAARLTGDARDGLAVLDEALAADPERMCCSVLLAVLRDGGEVELASAGHPSPLVVRGAAVDEVRLPGGPLLGVGEAPGWPAAPHRLAAGEALVLYTDGVTDAVAPGGERFGPGRLADALRGVSGGADALVAAVRDALDAHMAGPPADDIAVLALEYRHGA